MYAIVSAISAWLMPLLIAFILLYGWWKGTHVYESFVDGAKDGFEMAVKIIPHLVGMMVAIQLFRVSGALSWLVAVCQPVLDIFAIPPEIAPLALLRPLTGTGSLAYMADLTQQYGVESLISKMAATIQASTDTTLYVIAVYFGAVGIRNAGYALKVGLFSDFIGVIVSVIICRLVFA